MKNNNISQCTLVLVSTNKLILNLYIKFVSKFFTIQSKIYLPKKIKKITVLRSPHVNKKSREQFEIRYFKYLLIISPITYELFTKFRFILFKYIPANLSIKMIYK